MQYLDEFLEYLKRMGYVKNSILRYKYTILKAFNHFGCEEEQVVTEGHVNLFIRYLHSTELVSNTIYTAIANLRAFFTYLVKHDLILMNPMRNVELPRLTQAQNRHMSVEAVQKILNAIKANDEEGLTGRAMLEILYSTAMRPGELPKVTMNDVDFDEGFVMLRHTKTRRDRMVPVGKTALYWLNRYVREIRIQYLTRIEHDYLFPSPVNFNEPFRYGLMVSLLHRVMRKNGIKPFKLYMLRVSSATHLMQNGMSLLLIQQLLGHQTIAVTKRYLKVTTENLKETLTELHPGFNREVVPIVAEELHEKPAKPEKKVVRKPKPPRKPKPKKPKRAKRPRKPKKPRKIPKPIQLSMRHLTPFYSEYYAYLEQERLVKNSIIQYIQMVYDALQFVNKETVQELQVDDFKRYLGYLQDQNALVTTIKKRFGALKKYFSFLVDRGEILTNPVANIDIPKRPMLKRQYFTADEIQAIFKAIGTDDQRGITCRALFELLYDTSMMVSELTRLTIHDVDLKQQTVLVTNTVNKQKVCIQLGNDATSWLKLYIEKVYNASRDLVSHEYLFFNEAESFSPYIYRHMDQFMRRGIRNAKMAHFKLDSIRFSSVIHHINRGMPLSVLQERLGYQKMETVKNLIKRILREVVIPDSDKPKI